MAFTVEDGNGLPTANAYIDVAFADDYWTDRADASWAAADNTVKQVAIIKATDYIDKVFGSRFKGSKAFVTYPIPDESVDQALEFPRVDSEPYIGTTNWSVSSIQYPAPPEKPVALPRALKQACAEYALRALLNGKLLQDPEVDATGVQLQTKTENVGPIQTTYVYFNSGGVQVTQPYPAADLLLKSLLKPGGRSIRG
jgi:hypothetical protein